MLVKPVEFIKYIVSTHCVSKFVELPMLESLALTLHLLKNFVLLGRFRDTII